MLCPSNCPLNIDIHTSTSVPIVCIALTNCYVWFVITAKQTLEARTISKLNMSVSNCLPKPLIQGWVEFPHSLTKWKKTNSPRIKPQVLEMNLETSSFQKRFLLSISWYKDACGGKEHLCSSTERRLDQELQLPQLPSLVSDRHAYLI